MAITYFKAFHIIGAVAWFAGLFYLVRILVYLREAQDKPANEKEILLPQLTLMANRAYKIICNPAMMITWTCGVVMLALNTAYFAQGWLHVKLTLLIGLTVYHLYCKKWIRQLSAGENALSSFQLRLLNEVPTLMLVSIVLLAVVRNSLNVFYLMLGIFIFGGLLYWATKAYKRARERSQQS